jgi:hypothetical protein
MGRLYIEININGRPSVYTIEVLSGCLVLVGPQGIPYSVGHALKENISHDEALALFMHDPADVIPLLNDKVKVIGG